MIVTVTSIRLRSVWLFFKLSAFGFKILKQLKTEKGFIKMKNTGFGYDHYTISSWQSEEDLKRFSRSGAHSEAMKESRKMSTEIRTYTYKAESFPQWKEAKELLKNNAKVLNFN